MTDRTSPFKGQVVEEQEEEEVMRMMTFKFSKP
jgi:hypothetical protein